MNIKEALERLCPARTVGPLKEAVFAGVTDDSRDVRKGTIFVAVRGPTQDGHCSISEAVRRNAAAIVLGDEAFLPKRAAALPYALVRDPRLALSRLADLFYVFPYHRLKFVGVTGTNGKTTVSYLVRSVLEASGRRCGLIGTIGYRVRQKNLPLENTTPGVVALHRLAKEMADAGDKYAVMEVSSHALDQERVAGIVFRAAIFTNLTQDHLDYHGSMKSYFEAKRKLFTEYVDQRSALVINCDDPYGVRLLRQIKGQKISFGFSVPADVRVGSCRLTQGGIRARLLTPEGALALRSALVGRHNLSNILAAVAFGCSQGLPLESIRRGAEAVEAVPGRLERIDSKKGFSVFVDYAHTDDALKNVLESLRGIAHNGRIITVFGCGGDRDRGKRPKMGRVAAFLSDRCIVTSDNPRREDPKQIIAQIVAGIRKKNFEICQDRRQAILRALSGARRGDLVLIAGKGHETYQIIGGNRLSFDDRKVVRAALRGREKDV